MDWQEIQRFYTVSAKLYGLDFFVWTGMTVPRDTLSYLPLSHEKWQAITQVYERVRVAPPNNVHSSFLKFAKEVAIAMAATFST